MYLEVIATSLADVKKINQSQAARIELCSNMDQGGYTPDYQLIADCCALSKLPVRVMVRRSNDGFNISISEFMQLQQDIAFIKTTKAEGIVCGILTDGPHGKVVDIERMKIIIYLAQPLKVTFHRAFDEVSNQKSAMHTLTMLGVDTILTSGGLTTIAKRIKKIKQLVSLKLPITVFVGSGVNQKNINRFYQNQITNLHVGQAARIAASYDQPIAIELINSLLLIKN